MVKSKKIRKFTKKSKTRKSIKKFKMSKNPRIIKVKSHVKAGSRVKGHRRTKPDGIIENNYSYKG